MVNVLHITADHFVISMQVSVVRWKNRYWDFLEKYRYLRRNIACSIPFDAAYKNARYGLISCSYRIDLKKLVSVQP